MRWAGHVANVDRDQWQCIVNMAVKLKVP